MVECSASDPEMWVRFPLPAPTSLFKVNLTNKFVICMDDYPLILYLHIY